MWRLFKNVPTSSGKKNQHGREISTNLVRSIEEAIYKPPDCNTGKNIHTKKMDQKKVDWDALSYATSKATCNRSIWVTHLEEK